MSGITERLYGVVKEVYIPLEYSGYFGTTLEVNGIIIKI